MQSLRLTTVSIRTEELVVIILLISQLGEIDLVSQKTTNSSETLDELGSFLRLVGDKLEGRSELLVLLGEPFEQRLRLGSLFHLQAGGFVQELLAVLLSWCGVDNDLL